MIVFGIDPSTKTGLVMLGDGPEPLVCQVFNPIATGFSRPMYVGDIVRTLCEGFFPNVAVIEDYAFNLGSGRKGRQSAAAIVLQVEIGTLIRAALSRSNVPWWTIPPTILKKWATGRGDAKKPEMAEAVCKRWGFENPSDDIVDAYALARFGQELQNKPPTLFKGVRYEG